MFDWDCGIPFLLVCFGALKRAWDNSRGTHYNVDF